MLVFLSTVIASILWKDQTPQSAETLAGRLWGSEAAVSDKTANLHPT